MQCMLVVLSILYWLLVHKVEQLPPPPPPMLLSTDLVEQSGSGNITSN